MLMNRSTASPERHGRRRPAAARAVVAATLALGLPLAGWVLPAAAAPAVVFDYTITGGLVTPQDPACFNPFEGCAMDVTGVAVGTLSGALSVVAEWDFQAVMALAPVSATEWSSQGIYSFMRRLETATDEPADLLGIFTGTFDINTFTATIDYEAVPGNGLLAGLQGSGRSAVTIIPGPDGNTFDEQGRFEFGEATPVPLPGTPALAMLGLLLATTVRRRPTPGGRPHRATASWLGNLLALMLATGAQARAQSTPDPAILDETFARAMALYDRKHWASAWRLLAELADQGHRDAAWLALKMWRHGPQLYGMSFDAPSERRARWLTLVDAPWPDLPWKCRPQGR